MYYLFLKKSKDLAEYKKEFDRVRKSIDEGKTPVFNEIRSMKTNFIESIPFNVISGFFIVMGSILIDKVKMNELIKIAFVMVVNSFCYQLASVIFTTTKHKLRIRLCKRLGIEPSERNIAVMESLEYQSV
jgi:ABC-type bacteriocin/lantibiotic exporter with double-glycine peptidase domain